MTRLRRGVLPQWREPDTAPADPDVGEETGHATHHRRHREQCRVPALIENLDFVTVQGGPHNIAWTHPDEVNGALLAFLAR